MKGSTLRDQDLAQVGHLAVAASHLDHHRRAVADPEIDLRLLAMLVGPGEGLVEVDLRLLQLAGAHRLLAPAPQLLERDRAIIRQPPMPASWSGRLRGGPPCCV